jgi:hypothetical protein
VESRKVMTLERGAVDAGVKIRVPRHVWIRELVMGVAVLVVGAAAMWRHGPLDGPYWLTLGGIGVAAALWARTLGVDLTGESANLRGFRRRSVPWKEVQAVIRYGSGSMCVRLILEGGKRVTLRAPRTDGIFGVALFDRDFQRIDQWWLAHRGESWRPANAETPPVQGRGSRARRCF